MTVYKKSGCPGCGQLRWTKADDTLAAKRKCGRCEAQLGEHTVCSICTRPTFDPVGYARVVNESWENNHCGHRFCRGCLQAYAGSKLEDGISQIRCPEPGCCYHLIEVDMKKIFGCACAEDFWPGLPKDQKGVNRQFRKFCDLKASNHRQSLLEVLADKPPADEEFHVDWLRKNCQACPMCFLIVRKEEGCNTMVCKCGAVFCYGCGAPQVSRLGQQSLGEGCQCPSMRNVSERERMAYWLKEQGFLRQTLTAEAHPPDTVAAA